MLDLPTGWNEGASLLVLLEQVAAIGLMGVLTLIAMQATGRKAEAPVKSRGFGHRR
ncbi:hypothetical protein [Zavarzinia compransoris]|uniref:hypothetical protein n=1 Tax=Zavarzinia compransoris TaxID=1264899 RepID=UPI0010DDC400|nr:hypothetical protein [Zavarzinia compransoris]TDP48176.1 hypothetical protein DES42_102479 [Zavarzinia compransoris]